MNSPSVIPPVSEKDAFQIFTSFVIKDILYLRVLPHRPARLREVAEDFYACTHTADPGEVVGFEIHYFSLIEPSDLAEAVLQPYLDMRFDFVDSDLKNATLRQILEFLTQS